MTGPRLPADQAQREAVLTALDETLFVEAGAGTGKTTALVGRIARLVATGRARIQEVAAITFTEAAASELRDRIRLQFEADGGPASSLPAEEAGRCRAALPEIDAAAFQTLHGFAQRLLLQAPLEAGLPPRIEVLDPVRAHIAFDERWEQALDELLGDGPAAETVRRAVLLGFEPKHLEAIARAFHEDYHRLAGVRFAAGRVAPPLDAAAVLRPLEAALALAGECADPADLLCRHLHEAVAPHAADLRAALGEGEEATVRVLAREPRLAADKVGRVANWGAARAEVVALLGQASLARDAALGGLRDAALRPLLDAVAAWVLQYAGERRKAGTLEFNDLLVLARDLLRSRPDVRRRLGAQWRTILIDEFQDTDPIQLEIVALLAAPAGAPAAAAWEDVQPIPGKLFFVGDPKQAIFRFRGADVALYQRARERLAARHVPLTHNFRSVPTLLTWANHIFAELIGTAERPGQPGFRGLTPHRRQVQAGPAVHLLGGRHDGAAVANAAELRESHEAPEIAAAIRAIRDDGWLVEDGEGDWRPARLQDITLIVPARTTLPALEQALEAEGIPYRVESRSLLYATQEARDLVNILAAVDDPTDEVALVAALRSAAFACSDPQLYEWKAAGGRWDYRRSSPPGIEAQSPVALAMATLRQWHDERWWWPVDGLLARVIRERRLFELALAHARPRDHWQRLRFLLDQARQFADEGGISLRSFVAWLRRQAEEDVRVVESAVPQPDDDAIRITTMHAAKGLEYRVVVMAGLNGAPANRSQVVLFPGSGAPEVKAGRLCTAGYDGARSAEAEMQAFERRRLLYVGATRARDHLIVSLHHREPGGSTYAHELWELCEREPSLHRRFEPGRRVAEPPPGAAPAPPGALARREAWAREREVLRARAARPQAVAATAIAHEPAGEPPPGSPRRGGRGGTALGRAVHTVLQAVDLETGAGLRELARAQAMAEGIPALAVRVEQLARAALAAPSVRQAVAGGRYWREVYVAAPIDGIVVEGFIDLLYDGPEGLVVVDYKTDGVDSEAEVAEAMGRYRLQGGAYALALAELGPRLGRPLARCVFVFARGDSVREAVIEDLDAVIAEVRARLPGA